MHVGGHGTFSSVSIVHVQESAVRPRCPFLLLGSPGLATHRMQQQSRVALSLPDDVKRSPTCTACGPAFILLRAGIPNAVPGSACCCRQLQNMASRRAGDDAADCGLPAHLMRLDLQEVHEGLCRRHVHLQYVISQGASDCADAQMHTHAVQRPPGRRLKDKSLQTSLHSEQDLRSSTKP